MDLTSAQGVGGREPARVRRVRSAERVAAVLELLCQSPRPLRHSDVARAMSLPKSTASNLLDTMTDVGLIRRSEAGYSLGIKLIELGAMAAERMDLASIARPVMRELSEIGIGTANLGILQGHNVLYIEKLTNPNHLIQIATRVGGIVPAHATALGKVLVAALSPEEREEWLLEHSFTPITEHTITSADDFARALDRCSEQGYAVDDEESNLRVLCISAPVRDHAGRTVAAMSLTCLSSEVKDDRATAVGAVIAGAARVSSLLGAHSGSRLAGERLVAAEPQNRGDGQVVQS